ncbi:MAG TPA: hypothetical protein VF595_04185 [Tepidisphaeraceae bacterium]
MKTLADIQREAIEAVSGPRTLLGVQYERFTLLDASHAVDSGWRTISGVHVHIGAGGKIDKGPAALRGKTHAEAVAHHREHGHNKADPHVKAEQAQRDRAAGKKPHEIGVSEPKAKATLGHDHPLVNKAASSSYATTPDRKAIEQTWQAQASKMTTAKLKRSLQSHDTTISNPVHPVAKVREHVLRRELESRDVKINDLRDQHDVPPADAPLQPPKHAKQYVASDTREQALDRYRIQKKIGIDITKPKHGSEMGYLGDADQKAFEHHLDSEYEAKHGVLDEDDRAGITAAGHTADYGHDHPDVLGPLIERATTEKDDEGKAPLATRASIQRRLLEHHESHGGDTADTDLAGEHAGEYGSVASERNRTFRGKLPGEVKDFLQGRFHLRRLFKTTGSATDAGGADALGDMGTERYLDAVERMGRGTLGRALRTAKQSSEPEIRFLAAVHEHAASTPKGETRAPLIHFPTDKLQAGHSFTIHGEKFSVEEPDEGERVLVGPQHYPDTALDALTHLPFDRGSLRRRRTAALPAMTHAPADDIAPFSRTDLRARMIALSQGGLFTGPSTVGSQERLFGKGATSNSAGTQKTARDGAGRSGDGHWVTAHGHPVFIGRGQSVGEALRTHFNGTPHTVDSTHIAVAARQIKKQGGLPHVETKDIASQPAAGSAPTATATAPKAAVRSPGRDDDNRHAARPPAATTPPPSEPKPGDNGYAAVHARAAQAHRDRAEMSLFLHGGNPKFPKGPVTYIKSIDEARKALTTVSPGARAHLAVALRASGNRYQGTPHVLAALKEHVQYQKTGASPVPEPKDNPFVGTTQQVVASVATDRAAGVVDNNKQLSLVAKDAAGNPIEVGEKIGQGALFRNTAKPPAPSAAPKDADAKLRDKFDESATGSMFDAGAKPVVRPAIDAARVKAMAAVRKHGFNDCKTNLSSVLQNAVGRVLALSRQVTEPAVLLSASSDGELLVLSAVCNERPAVTLAQGLPDKISGLPMHYRWCDAGYVGNWKHPATGQPVDITPKRIDTWVGKVKLCRSRGMNLPVCLDHNYKDSRATVGEIFDARRSGDRLDLLLGFKGDDALTVGQRNYLSVGISPNLKDSRGNALGDAIHHVAVTPCPVIHGQQGFLAN